VQAECRDDHPAVGGLGDESPARDRLLRADSCHRIAPYLRLASRPVERENQLAAEALPLRVCPYEPFELGDELAGAAQLEVGRHALLERAETELLKPPDLPWANASKIRERRAAPQCERCSNGRGWLPEAALSVA
jgi:hypothetical protein